MTYQVVDTNVAEVASGRAPHASLECQIACIDRLVALKNAGVLVLDEAGAILAEYRRQMSRGTATSVGDLFFVWACDNQAVPEKSLVVPIAEDAGRGYLEFPADPALTAFDWDDRKFVAVALASAVDPPILNAVDMDWWDHRHALRANGVRVESLCPKVLAKMRRGG